MCCHVQRGVVHWETFIPTGMLKAVIFDLDGTLGDTLPLCVEAYRDCVERLGHPKPTAEEVVSFFGLNDSGVLAGLLGMQPAHSELPIESFVESYERLHPVLAPEPFPGTLEMMRKLKSAGIRIGIISGKEHFTGNPTIRYFGLEAFVEWRGFGLATHNCKHERLHQVMQEWNLSPDELVYVGDAPSDIELSHRAGVRIINAAWASTAAQDEAACLALKPDWRLTRFEELLPLILSL